MASSWFRARPLPAVRQLVDVASVSTARPRVRVEASSRAPPAGRAGSLLFGGALDGGRIRGGRPRAAREGARPGRDAARSPVRADRRGRADERRGAAGTAVARGRAFLAGAARPARPDRRALAIASAARHLPLHAGMPGVAEEPLRQAEVLLDVVEYMLTNQIDVPAVVQPPPSTGWRRRPPILSRSTSSPPRSSVAAPAP